MNGTASADACSWGLRFPSGNLLLVHRGLELVVDPRIEAHKCNISEVLISNP